LIRERADGTLWTAAKWIREFVASHEDYKHDSVVGEQINHDLIGEVIAIENPENGRRKKSFSNMMKFLGDFTPCGLGV
jgi:glutamate--cysteine ligase catalytic subunit